MKKITLLISMCFIAYSMNSQCILENGSNANTVLNATFNQIGQSFTASCNGILNSVGVLTFSSEIVNVSIYEGEGYSGTNLGTLTNQPTHPFINNTDYSMFDFSSLNITLISGQKYTFDISSIASGLVYDSEASNDYSGGQRYNNELPQANDLLFIANLDAIPCSNPDVPTINHTPLTVCNGNSADLNITGNLNDATEWVVYTSSCGGTVVGSTSSNTISVTPNSPSTTYYIRGEGGCVTPGSCGTITVNITNLDNASFNYNAAAFCIDDTDPTPTITGLTGGTFSSTAGLNINTTTGEIDLSASSPNTYTVTYTTAGACPNSDSTTVTVNALDDASFNYDNSAYCVDNTDPTPTITGLTGGTFSSTTGLSINTTTGEIDLSASTPNTYTVTYTTTGTCPNSNTTSVTINPLDNASFNYDAAAYCIDGSDPTPSIIGLTGGTFSSTAGLNINTTTGEIDLSASTPNTYIVTYTTAGTCPNSDTASVTINALDNASFNYSAAAFCIDDTDPTPTITGLTGGTFSSTPGLSINGSTGEIDLSASTPNTYTVNYLTAGTCPNNDTTSITINALDNASFNYDTAAYCIDGSDPTPTITGLAGGTFSSTAGLSISASTGEIDLSTSTPNTYTITYTTAGTCPNNNTASITINALDNASFNYSAANYCIDDSDPTPTITGLAGGTFSSTTGLSISASTGEIDLSASTPNTYTVTYTTAGTCPNNNTASITINALDNASFNYTTAVYCIDGSDPTPTITGLAGGTFSSTTGLSISASSGEIDLSASTPNTYTITYITSGICPNNDTASVTITPLDSASFNYTTAAYCIDGSDPAPTITGLAGGIFSSTTGLSISASTGEIDLSASTPNTYTITYTTTGICPNSDTASVTINTLDNASFNYNTTNYCIDDSDPTPIITGLTGGTFSSTPGLNINTSTGEIDLSTSTPNTYTVTYTTTGICPNSDTTSVTINTLDNASFNYDATNYCIDDSDPTPTITGLTGGTFSSTPGLSISASTGEIDLSTSTPNTYTVTYTTIGICPNSDTTSVTINTLDNASFNYDATTYCTGNNDPTPAITGLTGGTFSSTSGLIINASTGEIDLSSSLPNTYTITYTTNGTCSSSDTTNITINDIDNASFNYNSAIYCTDDNDPTPTINGLPGGVFSSIIGLNIDSLTGIIDLSESIPNTYEITYTIIGGTCPNSSSTTVTINQVDATVDDSSIPLFTANTTGATYQWIDCDIDQAITGEINQSFTATRNGNYAVDITTNGCTVRSSCYTVNSLSTEEETANKSALIYPNPTSGIINVNKKINTITVYTVTGKIIMKTQNSTFDISQFPSGIYFVAIETEKAYEIQKITKQ